MKEKICIFLAVFTAIGSWTALCFGAEIAMFALALAALLALYPLLNTKRSVIQANRGGV